MTKTVTIQGIVVEMSTPYEEGHKITEAEAKALNQMRAENIGNNLRKTVKDMIETSGGEVTDKLAKEVQKMVTERDSEYEFTLATVAGGGTKLDPLTKEARAVAKAYITGQLKEAGKTIKAYDEENGEGAFKAKVIELSEYDAVVNQAKKNLAARQEIEFNL